MSKINITEYSLLDFVLKIEEYAKQGYSLESVYNHFPINYGATMTITEDEIKEELEKKPRSKK